MSQEDLFTGDEEAADAGRRETATDPTKPPGMADLVPTPDSDDAARMLMGGIPVLGGIVGLMANPEAGGQLLTLAAIIAALAPMLDDELSHPLWAGQLIGFSLGVILVGAANIVMALVGLVA